MKTKSNLISLLVGAALGAGAVLSIAAIQTDTSSGGRFQLLVSNDKLFKIDTATGQIWWNWLSSLGNPSSGIMRPNIGEPAAAAPKLPPNLEKATPQ
jgi:hypothetical protein